MFDDELDVFFDEGDFAARCTRSRPGESDVQFAGILATVDVDRFDGHVTLGQTVVRYATAAVDLLAGDVVRTVRTTESGSELPVEVWTVMRSPERVVDGAESDAFLKLTPEA